MPGGRLLIIAPDGDLRSSLVFLLEAAGYVVTSRPDISSYPKSETFDCTVLDHQAIPRPDLVIELKPKLGPIILLAGGSSPWLESLVFRVVRKPLLGEPLIAAVEAALRSVRSGGRGTK
ncbi:hypothetical protein ASD04_11075 [Devosia sp. Root436]|jgi:hypothetical protein|nr:hypothetical protein ASD04_11075 [Devosia sp. Root436]